MSNEVTEQVTPEPNATPKVFTANGVEFRAVDLYNELTVAQTEDATKIIGEVFPYLVAIAAGKSEVSPMDFIKVVVSQISTGNLRKLIVLLTKPTQAELTTEQHYECAGAFANSDAFEVIRSFFGSIGG